MSYLNNLRMVFSGRFQSDVSTVNNDVRHFDVDKFVPEYQEYGPGATNGWWNPCGSGAFRLIDCRVTQVGYQDGTTTSNPAKDPVIGMLLGGSNDLVSAKMVDLDPQMQMVSEIWGLTMRLTDGKTPEFVAGRFLPAPFRDILFGRQQGGGAGDQAATAIYQSVLEDLSWVDTSHSPFLQQLKAMTEQVGKLSVRMMLYSYNMDHKNPDFTIGRVSGVIGPALDFEPDTFVLGRRFAPANGDSTKQNINFFNAQVDAANRNLCVDFSNALPLSGNNGAFVDLGKMQLVVLEPPFENIKEGDTQLISGNQFTPIGGAIPYLTPDWLNAEGALFNVTDIDPTLLQKIQNQPLALLSTNNNGVLIRETAQGLLVRADQVVHRLNPAVPVSVDLYASRYGIPAVGEKIAVTLQPPAKGMGGGGPQPADVPIPVINIPASAISLGQTVATDSHGKAHYGYSVSAPGNPREYIDGQVYLLSYTPVSDPDYIQQMFDFIANLVFDKFTVPDKPTWDDIKPIMSQYNNLYPIMGRMLVNLSSYDSMVRFRNLLELAFSREQNDPNYMPVTRDLSEPKRQMVLKWLCEQDANGNYLLRRGQNDAPLPIEPCASCEISSPLAKASLEAESSQDIKGSKELAAEQYRRNFTQQD
ncbi:hypothetical protein [Photobacterium sp. Hal280]|uniref:hypothetical protein n=1 Tax=Photobacterium sp. Hal280 TaxID=3035163 RepID=UPI00301D56CA